MAKTTRNYWAYRIDKSNSKFLNQELQAGRLRQGWGYDKGQDLRILSVDNGARRNLPIYKKVKKGDLLIIPHISGYNQLTLATASEDWEQKYRFEIDPTLKDFGHIFPAKIERVISKNHSAISANLRRSLKNPSRFWSLNSYTEDIEHILELSEAELHTLQSKNSMETTTYDTFYKFFNKERFQESLYENCTQKFQNAEWEKLLVDALQTLYPSYLVEHTGGHNEQFHGTDIKITIPGLFGQSYIIAIQVKDYEGIVSEQVIEQINKADKFNDDNTKVIEKIVLVTRASKEQNKKLQNNTNVQFVFLEELKELLANAGQTLLGLDIK